MQRINAFLIAQEFPPQGRMLEKTITPLDELHHEPVVGIDYRTADGVDVQIKENNIIIFSKPENRKTKIE
jgi:hypothetical protein